MRSFLPQPGSFTVCEILGKLITSETISEDIAKETYGKYLGVVFSPIPCQSHSPTSRRPDRGRVNGFSLLKRLLGIDNAKLLPNVDLKFVSWHQKMDILAFVSSWNQVTVHDYGCSGERTNHCILMNELQREATVLEWRPNAGRTLSVGCKGGICIWAGSYSRNTALVRPGFNSGSSVIGCGVSWTLVDFLRGHGDEQISSLSWSPDGRYVAFASYESSSFMIWDYAQGPGRPIRRGSGSISLLKWSPTGDFLFVAKFDGTFLIWETNSWTFKLICSPNGPVSGAAWSPDASMILIAFSGSLQLNSILFDTKCPRWVALSLPAELSKLGSSTISNLRLAPVELPELRYLTSSQGIEKIAWNAAGERLAIAHKEGKSLYSGLIAIYDVARVSGFSPSLIGFIRGPGDDPKPLTFAFHDKYTHAPLLSVCWSTGACVTYPLVTLERASPI